MLLLQSAWVLSVPPFRGIDEHDHAYKAAAVARGDWSATHRSSPQGWGEFVRVPRDLVEAAEPVCSQLPYTTPDNCVPRPEGDDGLVEVSSSAARYNPVFYYLMGAPATSFTGARSLYVMRIATALLCSLLVAAAVTTTRSWARTRFPLLSVVLVLTPTMIYSTTVAAPNGVEMTAALLTWSALLGVGRETADARGMPRYVLVAAVGMIPLVSVRTLGPLWLALILVSFLVLVGIRPLIPVMRSRVVVAAATAVVVATAAAIRWSWTAGTNSLPDTSPPDLPALGPALLKHLVLWPLQAIGAFPSRNEEAPLPLYAINVAVLCVALVFMVRHARRRERMAMALVVCLSAAIPTAFTVATYDQVGAFWQGRYGYPLAMGLVLIGGVVLDRRATTSAPITRLAVGTCVAALGLTQLIGTADVLTREQKNSPLSRTSVWIDAPVWVLGLLVVGGCAALTAAVLTGTQRRARARPEKRCNVT